MIKVKQEENNKYLLLAGLRKQVLIMNENSELLKKVCHYLRYDVELAGAAKITQTWIDGIAN